VSTFDREALEAERDFLLRSLDDLDDERAAGNVDAGTYRELHDDYTARAAAVIRSLDDGTALAVPEPARASMRRRALTAAGIVAFAIVAAVLLSHAVGQRRPGQTITGNGQVASGSPPTSNPGRTLAAAVQREPRSYAAHIAYARYLMGTRSFAEAIREFGAAARLDPSQPEPPTYAGWLGALVSQQVSAGPTRQSLLTASLARINDVIKSHPQYPDAHAFKGVILFDFEHNARDAIPSFQRFLLLTDETNPLRAQVLGVLAEAEKAA
jgi:hypothetical protein